MLSYSEKWRHAPSLQVTARVRTADPTIIDAVVAIFVIRQVEAEPEADSVQRDRAVEFRDFKHNGDQSPRGLS